MLLAAAASAGTLLVLSHGMVVTSLRHPLQPPPPAPGAPAPLRYYPQHAQENGITGEAKVRCKVLDLSGRVGDCRSVSESPPGEGFGDNAALLAASFLRLAASDVATLSSGGALVPDPEVEVPVSFVFKDNPPK